MKADNLTTEQRTGAKMIYISMTFHNFLQNKVCEILIIFAPVAFVLVARRNGHTLDHSHSPNHQPHNNHLPIHDRLVVACGV